MAVEYNQRILDNLPPRQREIAKLVAIGFTNREVGQELGIAEDTVKTQLSRIYDALGVCNRVRLTIRLISSVH